MSKHNDQERALFEAYMHGREHPGFGWIDSHWFRRGDDPAGYANEYVQGAWVMWQALAQLTTAGVAVPQMVDFSPVPDDFRNQADGYRAGWNDCRAMLTAPHPVSGEQKAAVQAAARAAKCMRDAAHVIGASSYRINGASATISALRAAADALDKAQAQGGDV